MRIATSFLLRVRTKKLHCTQLVYYCLEISGCFYNSLTTNKKFPFTADSERGSVLVLLHNKYYCTIKGNGLIFVQK